MWAAGDMRCRGFLLGGTAGLYIWYVSGAEYAKTGAAPTHETDGTERAAGAVV